MYYFSGLFVLLLAVMVLLNIPRKKKIVKKVSCMSMDEKYQKLNQLIEPFGYCYNNCQDVFSSTIDAWQKDFGYIFLYDKIAPRINLVFDCEPIYFYYDEKTWLIELWKGQYGINSGCEVGIYYADRIVPRVNLKKTLFRAVPSDEMLPISINLIQGNDSIARLTKRHWWLTAFRMGSFKRPSKLAMNVSITFPTREMLDAFVHAMLDLGYLPNDMCICNLQVFFTFDKPFTKVRGFLMGLSRTISLFQNRILCWLYRFITRPFCLSVDRLLYLYFYIPFAFRRMIRLKRFKKFKIQRGQ
ncbi:MAG: DUF4474 domain-containing protein [Lachnospiraceae bacterium]|jgi:hypothetical protein|nr:DUF4474 domain-containing protein [Lachnospiraceae bacterium]